MKIKEVIDSLKVKKQYPAFRVGDTVRVHVKIKELEKERIQAFEGVVIKKRRGGKSASFIVRKVSYGIGVERVFPMESAAVEKLEIVKRGKVRRARLFHLRSRRGRAAQVKTLDRNAARNKEAKVVSEENTSSEASEASGETPEVVESASASA